MTITLILFGGAVALELLAYICKWRPVQGALAAGALFAGGLAASALVALCPNVFTVLLLVLSAYRMFNMVRIVQRRMHDAYLRRTTRRTGLLLLGLQALCALIW